MSDYTPTMDSVANAAVESGYFDRAEVNRALDARDAEVRADERARIAARRDEVAKVLEVAMLGTTDGDLIDPDSEVPAGEMYRLALVAIPAVLAALGVSDR